MAAYRAEPPRCPLLLGWTLLKKWRSVNKQVGILILKHKISFWTEPTEDKNIADPTAVALQHRLA